MTDLVITISGPGTTFDKEYSLLYQTLKNAGFKIEEVNAYPPKDEDKENYDFANKIRGSKSVKLVAQHNPWGG